METKKSPILYQNKSNCCGCGACFAICPKKCINMIEDEEGFAFPIINPKECVKCYLCESVCPIKHYN